MTFFNPKEDVLDIKLTQYGKHLLSQGKLKPSYYLFFDDDVLYDSNCVGNSLEVQNSVEARIQEETPKIRTQHTFSDTEEVLNSSLPPSTVESRFSLINSLGTSDPMSSYSPKWEIKMFGEDGPTITSATEYLETSLQTLRVPQIDITCEFKTTIASETGESIIGEDPNLSSTLKGNGTYIAVQPRTVLMQVLEKYSVFEKENFDIEVYIKDTIPIKSGPDIEEWTPLEFKKKTSRIVDGVLVDEPTEKCLDLDATNVEYYFDIFVDGEVNEVTLEGISDSLKTQSMYLNPTSKSTSGAAFEIADIYSQVVPDDACSLIEEECKPTE